MATLLQLGKYRFGVAALNLETPFLRRNLAETGLFSPPLCCRLLAMTY